MQRKIDNRINDMFNKGEFDNDFINIKFNPTVLKNILPYQILHVMNLVAALKKSDTEAVIDGSNTGTGKTYTTIATCLQLNLRPYIICPKSIMGNWKMVCDMFGVVPIAIVNYETIRQGKEYDSKLNPIPSKHVNKKDGSFVWNFDKLQKKNVVIIFDEAHKCKHKNTLNGKLLLSAKNNAKIMLLSATLCDKPIDFMVYGYILKLYDTIKKGKGWIESIIVEDRNKFGKYESSLSKHIFPHHGSRMTMEDLGTAIPKNIVCTDCYTIDKASAKKINDEYEKIKKSLEKVEAGALTTILKARQNIEEHKVPVLIELCENYLELHHSVVIFVNFVKSLNMLKAELTKNEITFSYIVGGQTVEDRTEQIEKFQNNTHRVMLSMIQSGGESINLHDINGTHPRVSLISPSFSSIELVQALGRIYRTGTKSRVLQRLVFCDNTYETTVCNTIKKKIEFVNKLTDDDLLKF